MTKMIAIVAPSFKAAQAKAKYHGIPDDSWEFVKVTDEIQGHSVDEVWCDEVDNKVEQVKE